MSRLKSLWAASPRTILVALAGLMVAAALAVGSGANFNSTSANPSNVFTAGTISHSNSKANAAILTASNIVPGNTTTGTVDIKNTGSATGTFTLSHTVAVDTPASPVSPKSSRCPYRIWGTPNACPPAPQPWSSTRG